MRTVNNYLTKNSDVILTTVHVYDFADCNLIMHDEECSGCH